MKLVLSLCLALLTFAGQAQESPSKPNPARKEALIFRNSTLLLKQGDANDSLNFYPKMGKGSAWVFQYNYTAPEYPEMSDDEYFESFMFQIPQPKGTAFSLKGKDLAKANATFQKSCFCADRGYFRITEGSIVGKKINSNTWSVTVNIVIPAKNEQSAGAVKKKFTARYRIQSTSK